MGLLLFSVSGLRGIVGPDLTPEVITVYAAAFGAYLQGGKVVVGRDTRRSGEMVKHAVLAGLLSAGCEILDVGVVPTPTVNLIVREQAASGGVVITASHNPIEWNALKFINRAGLFLDSEEFEDFDAAVKQGGHRRVPWNEIKQVSGVDNAIDCHIERIIQSGLVGRRLAKLSIGVDAVNGAGSVALPKLLDAMGMKVSAIHCTPDGDFPRPPEPIQENLAALQQLVVREKLDLGFAVDPDCDRLAIVDDQGTAIGEEKTLVLAARHILSMNKGPVVTNLSTTRLIDDLAREYGVPVHRTKVGEANVVSKMREVGAVIGGEGNGGVILPDINFTRDALVGAALVMSLLHQEKKKLSLICRAMPAYCMVKKKVFVPNWPEKREGIMKCVAEHAALRDATMDLTDGFKFTGPDIWIHIRASQTEPVVRIVSEGVEEVKVKKLVKEVEAICVA